MKNLRSEELNEAKELRKALDIEKREIEQKKQRERQAAWKVIKENEIKEEKKTQAKKEDRLA